MYTPSGFVDSESEDGSIYLGQWHNRGIAQGFNNIRPIRGNRNRIGVVQKRDEIKEYLNSEERSLPWQRYNIRRTYLIYYVLPKIIWSLIYCTFVKPLYMHNKYVFFPFSIR